MCAHPLVIVYFDSFERNEQFASITHDFDLELSCGLLQLWLNRFPAAGYELRLFRGPAAGYKLRLTPIFG